MLGNMLVLIGLLGAFLWGTKAGYYETAVRCIGMMAATVIVFCFFRPLSTVLHNVALRGDWGLACGAAWIALLIACFTVFWILGNFFLERSRLIFYRVLDKVLGALFAWGFASLAMSMLFIGLEILPFTRKAGDLLTDKKGTLMFGVDSIAPILYATLFSNGGPEGTVFPSEKFMEIVRDLGKSKEDRP